MFSEVNGNENLKSILLFTSFFASNQTLETQSIPSISRPKNQLYTCPSNPNITIVCSPKTLRSFSHYFYDRNKSLPIRLLPSKLHWDWYTCFRSITMLILFFKGKCSEFPLKVYFRFFHLIIGSEFTQSKMGKKKNEEGVFILVAFFPLENDGE